MAAAKKKRAKRKSKKTATSKSGRKYERKAGKWVQVVAYRRTRPTRSGGPRDKAADFCSKTRKKKVMRVKRGE